MSGTVLVVDDDEGIVSVLATMLKFKGFTVLEAGNGREALQLLQSGARPSVILLDLIMPVMDGWEFRRAQKADAELCKIPVIVLSGVDSAEHDRSEELEATQFFSKPPDLKLLVRAVQRHCVQT